jgi:hypothetical protein
MRIAQLHEARRLVGRLHVDRAAQVVRVVGHQPDGPAFDARERRHDARAEARAQLEQRAGVGHAAHRGAHVVHAQPVLGHHVAQGARVGALPVGDRPLEVRQVLLRGGDRRGLVLHQDVDHAVARLHAARPDLLGREAAEAAALDHRGAAHADVAALRGDDHVGTAQQRRVAREAAAMHDADHRHLARERGELAEGVVVEARHDRHVGIAGPAAAALGEQHHRQPQLVRHREQPVGLVVVAHALRAGQHRVVVGQHGAARLLGAELPRVDAADAGHHAVGRRVGDQILERAAARLRRDGERAVLDEVAGIGRAVAEVGDVLARGAPALRMALVDGGPAVLVERERMAVDDLLQVGPDRVEVVRGARLVVHGLRVDRLQPQQRLALDQVVAGRGQQRHHAARGGRVQQVFHLHGLEHAELRARGQHVADRDLELHQLRGHRGPDREAVVHVIDLGSCDLRDDRRDLLRAFLERRCGRQQVAQVRLDEARVHRLRRELGPRGDRAQQRQVGGDALDAALVERAQRAAQCIGEARRGRMHDQLGQQHVVVRRGRQARIAVRVDTHAGPGGQLEAREHAARGPRLALRIEGLGVDAPLQREAALRRGAVGLDAERRQRFAGRHRDLQLHQVEPGHGLGHRVLDLQPRIGLDEDKGQRGRGRVDQELEGAEPAIAHGPGHAQRGLRELRAQRLGQRGTGRDLHQLLEAPLQGALALAETGHGLAVAEHLHLDVTRIAHQPLDVHALDAEGRARFRHAARMRLGQLAGLEHRAHAAPAAAADGLDHHARALRLLLGEEGLRLRERHRARAAGHHGHLAARGQFARARLVAEQRELLGRGPDEDQARIGAGLREVGALAEEAVARMHRVAALRLRGRDQRADVEVGRGPGRVERERHVGQLHVEGRGVVARMHGHAGDAEVAQGAHQAHGDLAAVGNQDFGKHAGSFSSCL